MTESDLITVVVVGAAAVMAGVVVYFAVKGPPGVVSLSPPEGSPRWPVYGFFIPWFLAAFVGASRDVGRVVLWLRLIEFFIVLSAFFISWRRQKAAPTPPPPRI